MTLDYYDALLAAIGASVLLGGLAGVALEVDFEQGLVGGALVATLLVYVALFRNPPSPAERPRARAAAVGAHVALGALLAM